MFEFANQAGKKVINPLGINKSSIIEFSAGKLADTGIYRFNKIIEFTFGERSYCRYLIFSRSEATEYILEVFPCDNDQFETYLYSLEDTVEFSEDFLDVAGQRYLTTPDGTEYERCIDPDNEDRIEGLVGKAKIYNVEAGQIEQTFSVKVWDYKRELEAAEELLNIEMSEENGLFKIFKGEMLENIFYKIYQG